MSERTPRRIQRKRQKGWRMPDRRRAAYVGRPTKWGNPFHTGDRAADVEAFRAYAESVLGRDILQLKGKDLMCWCPINKPCHADVLLEIANDFPQQTAPLNCTTSKTDTDENR